MWFFNAWMVNYRAWCRLDIGRQFEIITLIFAVYFAYRAYKESHSQVKIAQETLIEQKESTRIENRAYVSFEFDSINLIDSGFVAAYAHITNGGHTPAKNVRHVFYCRIYPINNLPIPPFKPFMPFLGRTLHNGKTDQLLSTQDSVMTKEMLVRIKNESAFLYCWANVEYDDCFGDHHFTHFAARYYAPGEGMANYSTYNDAD